MIFFLQPGNPLAVGFDLDVAGIAPPPLGWGNNKVYVRKISFDIYYDNIELEPINSGVLDTYNSIFTGNPYKRTKPDINNTINPGVSRLIFEYLFDPHPLFAPLCPGGIADCGKFLQGGNFDRVLNLGSVFIGKNVEEFPGDGFTDVKVTGLVEGFALVPHPGLGDPVQFEGRASFDPVFEVQDVPGPLPILGLGVMGVFTKKLRKLRRIRKTSPDSRENRPLDRRP